MKEYSPPQFITIFCNVVFDCGAPWAEFGGAAIGVNVGGGIGSPLLKTSIPLICGSPTVPDTKSIVILPSVTKGKRVRMYELFPPALRKMSKLSAIMAPSMKTSNTRKPFA